MAATTRTTGDQAIEASQRRIEELEAELADLQASFERIKNELYVAIIKLGGRMEMEIPPPYPPGFIHIDEDEGRIVFTVEIGSSNEQILNRTAAF